MTRDEARTACNELIQELRISGIRAALVDDEVIGVNVWARHDDRYPETSVWSPTEVPTEQQWIWGRSFEHTAPGDIRINQLAKLVIPTLA